MVIDSKIRKTSVYRGDNHGSITRTRVIFVDLQIRISLGLLINIIYVVRLICLQVGVTCV